MDHVRNLSTNQHLVIEATWLQASVSNANWEEHRIGEKVMRKDSGLALL